LLVFSKQDFRWHGIKDSLHGKWGLAR
jgi:hypothetical protein